MLIAFALLQRNAQTSSENRASVGSGSPISRLCKLFHVCSGCFLILLTCAVAKLEYVKDVKFVCR